MNWIKSTQKQPPTSGITFLALWNDTPVLAEYDPEYQNYKTASIDPINNNSRQPHKITYWCNIEKP